jgi:preprotein translocase subunit YajC
MDGMGALKVGPTLLLSPTRASANRPTRRCYNQKLSFCLVYPSESEVVISNAFAQASSGASGPESLLASPLPMVVIFFVIMYFLMIRPQQKRAKEQRTMMESLKAGDEVITSGGILGKVTKVVDQYVTVEVAQAGTGPVELLVQKASVQTMLPKGTIKSI